MGDVPFFRPDCAGGEGLQPTQYNGWNQSFCEFIAWNNVNFEEYNYNYLHSINAYCITINDFNTFYTQWRGKINQLGAGVAGSIPWGKESGRCTNAFSSI